MNRFDVEIMARTAMGEARGEGEAGMQAVMWTGVNRFSAKKWFSAASIAGTFLRPFQYSCWNHDDPNFHLICDITEEVDSFSKAVEWAYEILSGGIIDPTKGATHYFADTIPQPNWAKDATFTVKIGRHSFYKNVN